MDKQTQPPLKCLTYAQHLPSAGLAGHVACYWTLTGESSTPCPRIRVFPDCCMDAIFDLNGGLSPAGRVATLKPSTFFTGASLSPMLVELPPSPRIIGIRFRPGGAAPFLGFPAHEITGSSAELTDVLPSFTSLACSFAGEAHSPGAMVAAIERLLLERLARTAANDALTAHALKRLARPGPAGRVEKVAQEMGLTQKRLERAFKHNTGLTPKEMGRALRFIDTVRALGANPRASLSGLALDMGYADQAHFNREFKQLAGIPPTTWLLERDNVEFVQYPLTRIV